MLLQSSITEPIIFSSSADNSASLILITSPTSLYFSFICSSLQNASLNALIAASGFFLSITLPLLYITRNKNLSSGRLKCFLSNFTISVSGATQCGTVITGLSVYFFKVFVTKSDGVQTSSTSLNAGSHSSGNVSSSHAQYPMLYL